MEEENIKHEESGGFSVRPARRKNTGDVYVYYSYDDDPVDDSDELLSADVSPDMEQVSKLLALESRTTGGTKPEKTVKPAVNAAEAAQKPEAPEAPAAEPARKEVIPAETTAEPSRKEEIPAENAAEPARKEDIPAEAAAEPAQKSEISEAHAEYEPELAEVPEKANVVETKVRKMFVVIAAITMAMLCVMTGYAFVQYVYMNSIERVIYEGQQKLDKIENTLALTEKAEQQAAEKEAEAAEVMSLIKEAEARGEEETVKIENGKLLLYDSYVGYSWAPVLAGVKRCEYDKECFSRDARGRMVYKKDGEISSYCGIDVSVFQKNIDWDAVRADGVEFAILRVGLRGYGAAGNMKADESFADNYKGAHEAGIDVGVYFFSQAVSVEEAIEEAEFALELIGDRTLEYPVVFDWEPADVMSGDDAPRTEDVMPETLTLAAVAFCETVKKAGYDAMIYTNKKMAYIKYDLRLLQNYPVWLALYSDDLTYYYDFDIWQYGLGEVDGIEGEVDMNIAIIR